MDLLVQNFDAMDQAIGEFLWISSGLFDLGVFRFGALSDEKPRAAVSCLPWRSVLLMGCRPHDTGVNVRISPVLQSPEHTTVSTAPFPLGFKYAAVRAWFEASNCTSKLPSISVC